MFSCKNCGLNTESAGNFRKHIESKKHQDMLIKITEEQKRLEEQKQQKAQKKARKQKPIQPKTTESATTKFVCACCKKSFASNFSLERHPSACKPLQKLLVKNAKLINKLINDENLISDETAASNQPNITIVINNNTTNNVKNTTINNLLLTCPEDELPYWEYFSKAGVRSVGYETDEHINSQELIDDVHKGGYQALKYYTKHYFSNPENHNIAISLTNKLITYIGSDGMIKRARFATALSNITMNILDNFDNFMERTKHLIKSQYKKPIDALMVLHSSEHEIASISSYENWVRTELLNVKDSASENIETYKRMYPEQTKMPLKNIKIPRTDLRVDL
jgi:hypothetical protein